jgi:short-subunit dehydrogenase
LRSNETPVVIITGGSSGIGRCTADLFAGRGWRVGLIARGAEGLAASRCDLENRGAMIATAQADVTNSDDLHTAAVGIVAALGPIDLWINCAGVGVYGRFDDVPEADFKRVTDVTYIGAVNGTREALRYMRTRDCGTILNVCSAVAFHGLPLMSSYSGAKAALCAFSQALHGELRLQRSSIRVVTVFPPAVNTPFFDHTISHNGNAARPAWPVYQPEVIAQGIWQAFISGRSRMSISGTTVIFRVFSRIAPRLIAWCMTKIDFERQPTSEETARRFPDPALYVASRRFAGTRGAFGRGARNYSIQIWVQNLFTKSARLFLGARRGSAPPIVRLPPIAVPGEQD